MKKYILTFCFLFFIQLSFAGDINYSRVKIWFDGKSELKLGSLGIDLTEGEYRKDVFFISDFSEKEISRIQDAGFRIEILISDVKAFYRNRNSSSNRKLQQTSSCGQPAPLYPVPSHFYLGSMGGFFTYSELLDILDSMTLLYPNLITARQPVDTTHTIEGRPIYFLKISDNPNIDENEPKVMYTALHHAREPESLSQLIYYMWYLLENYATDTTVRALVDNTEMYFVPCVNPDGYLYNEFTNPQGGGLWRKNRRDNMDGEFGVDLNRNYGYQWGYDDIGSSNQTISETYRGTASFSEPETQAMKSFVTARQFKLALNYHTYGNHNIVPFGYLSDFLSPDSMQFDYYGHAITRYNNYHVGTANQTVNYMVNGNSDDWMYGEQLSKPKIFAMTPEVGQIHDGFWPALDRIIPLSQENMYANFTLARLAGHYGTISHNEQIYTSQINNEFIFSFMQLGLDTIGSFTISIVPVSSNIISTGASRIFTNLNSLQSVTDSISFTLSPSIAPADEIRYVISVDNGLFTEADTITQIYGSPVIAFNDDGSDITNWNTLTTTWGTTTEDYVSPPSSITDSPFNSYMPNSNNPLVLLNPVNLSGVIDARLTFYAKWNTERQYDYVQVLASRDNGNSWSALCGKYTVTGSAAEAPGEPVYDGTQNNWVSEVMSLNDFLGQSIILNFVLISDGFLQRDGFYFDDLKIKTIQNNIGISPTASASLFLSSPIPNPSSLQATVNYSNVVSGSVFLVYNTFGQLVWEKSLRDVAGKIQIPVNELPSGMYSYLIRLSDGSHSSTMKFIVGK